MGFQMLFSIYECCFLLFVFLTPGFEAFKPQGVFKIFLETRKLENICRTCTISTLKLKNVLNNFPKPFLGTLITEWDEGKGIWNVVLGDVDKISLFSRKLAEICAHFKFDGYLLNVENEIPVQLVPRLVQFVALLKADLDLHCGNKTWLIWYDSVTSSGQLKWQNKLCPINK